MLKRVVEVVLIVVIVFIFFKLHPNIVCTLKKINEMSDFFEKNSYAVIYSEGDGCDGFLEKNVCRSSFGLKHLKLELSGLTETINHE